MKGRTDPTLLQLAPQACYRLGTDAQRDALMEGVQGAIGAPFALSHQRPLLPAAAHRSSWVG